MLDTTNLFSLALGINEPWFIESIDFDEEEKILKIKLDFRKGAWFPFFDKNGKLEGTYKAYDTEEKEWRHLNFFEHECYLVARVPRIKNDKGQIQLYQPDWSGLANGFTLLFEAFIVQFAKSMPVNKIAKLLNVSDKKVWAMLDKYVNEVRKSEDFSQVKTVGMDETSIAKGHNYITMFVDMEEKRTIYVTEGKSNETVKAFKNDFEDHNGNIENIKDVSCDMSPAFIKGVQENLPNAEITFDKFHIVKLINEALDEVRRKEAVTNPLLKGTRYLFLKNDDNLTENQKQQKEELVLPKYNLKSMRALNLREAFQQIYNATDQDEFEILLKKWYYWATHSQLDPIKKVAKTIKQHWDGILQWKKSKINNGLLEGLNSIVQAAKSRARGYKLKHFRTIAYLITGNLNFNDLNYALPTHLA